MDNHTRIEIEFDTVRFMADVRAAIGNGVKTALRDIEEKTGISASSFSRVDKGGTMDMDTFMRVCARLNLTPRRLLQKSDMAAGRRVDNHRRR